MKALKILLFLEERSTPISRFPSYIGVDPPKFGTGFEPIRNPPCIFSTKRKFGVNISLQERSFELLASHSSNAKNYDILFFFTQTHIVFDTLLEDAKQKLVRILFHNFWM